jgi:hypothetical protein
VTGTHLTGGGTPGAAEEAAPIDAGGRHAVRRPPVWRRPAFLMAAVGLSAVVLTLVVMPPPQPHDSYRVWQAAEQWPRLGWNFPGPHHAMRLGTVLPTMVVQDIVGHNRLGVAVIAAILLVVFAIGVYALGRALFSDAVGLSAAAIILLHPFFTKVDGYSGPLTAATGSLYPDHPAAGWFLLGIAALVVASRRSDRPQARWLVAAGVCFAVAYLTREYLAFMFLGIPVYFWLLRIPLRRLVVPAVPMVAILAMEMLHNWVVWDSPFARLTVAGEHGTLRTEPLSRWLVLRGFLDAIAIHPLGWIFVGALALTIVGAVVFRDRRLMLLLVTFFSLWLPLTLLGGMIDPWEANLRVGNTRYWFAVLPAVTIGALGTLVLAYRRLGPAVARRVAVAAVVLASVAYLVPAGRVLTEVNRDEDWRALQSWFVAHPEVTELVTDDITLQTLRFYTHNLGGDPMYRGEVLRISRRVRTLPLQTIGHRPYLQTSAGPEGRPDPADGWVVLWRSPNAVLTIWQR